MTSVTVDPSDGSGDVVDTWSGRRQGWPTDHTTGEARYTPSPRSRPSPVWPAGRSRRWNDWVAWKHTQKALESPGAPGAVGLRTTPVDTGKFSEEVIVPCGALNVLLSLRTLGTCRDRVAAVELAPRWRSSTREGHRFGRSKVPAVALIGCVGVEFTVPEQAVPVQKRSPSRPRPRCCSSRSWSSRRHRRC